MPPDFRIIDKAFLDRISATLAETAAHHKHLSTLSETARALVGGAIAENMLVWALKSKMPGLSNRLSTRLYEGYGPLSTFSAKIDVAFAFKFIDATTHRDLRAIKEVRNAFAHAHLFVSFSSPKIDKECSKLSTWRAGAENYTLFQEAVERCSTTLRALIATELYADFMAWAKAGA